MGVEYTLVVHNPLLLRTLFCIGYISSQNSQVCSQITMYDVGLAAIFTGLATILVGLIVKKIG